MCSKEESLIVRWFFHEPIKYTLVQENNMTRTVIIVNLFTHESRDSAFECTMHLDFIIRVTDNRLYFSLNCCYPSTKTYIVGALKNRLTETVL